MQLMVRVKYTRFESRGTYLLPVHRNSCRQMRVLRVLRVRQERANPMARKNRNTRKHISPPRLKWKKVKEM